MKTLYLVRHAKSSWEFDIEDHERPLKERGLNDAALVAHHIKSKIEPPQKVISSDAIRAKTTALLYLREFSIPEEEFVLDSKLYDFTGRELDSVIRNCDNKIDRLMIFGHNDAMTNIVNKYGDKHIDNVSTAAFTCIVFDADSWQNIENGKTKFYITPKQLK
ncbi:MAG: histidine phosphatase family protein [Leeuwenhoekiella sp.]